jgi:hypothetical protein
MPLEISEIGIRMAVGDPASAGGTPTHGASAGAALSTSQMEELVSRCVQEVLRTLRMQEAR